MPTGGRGYSARMDDRPRWGVAIEQMQDTARQQFAKDSENKRFLDSALGKVVMGAGGAVALGLAALGGRVVEQRGIGKQS